MKEERQAPVLRMPGVDDKAPPHTIPLDPQSVRAAILGAMALPETARTPRLQAIREQVEGSPMGPSMEEIIASCPPPAGFTPEAAATHGDLRPGTAAPTYLNEDGTQNGYENPLRREMHVEHVPMVVISPCACGADRRTPHPEFVAAARRAGAELPPVRCSCGRWIQGFTPGGGE